MFVYYLLVLVIWLILAFNFFALPHLGEYMVQYLNECEEELKDEVALEALESLKESGGMRSWFS